MDIPRNFSNGIQDVQVRLSSLFQITRIVGPRTSITVFVVDLDDPCVSRVLRENNPMYVRNGDGKTRAIPIIENNPARDVFDRWCGRWGRFYWSHNWLYRNCYRIGLIEMPLISGIELLSLVARKDTHDQYPQTGMPHT